MLQIYYKLLINFRCKYIYQRYTTTAVFYSISLSRWLSGLGHNACWTDRSSRGREFNSRSGRKFL